MNAETKHARTIFLDAVENVSPPEWADYVTRVCGDDFRLRDQVQKLLAAHEGIGDFMVQPVNGIAETAAESSSDPAGTQIGPYKLLEVIGEGGMGTVYLAEQTEPVHRKVALKLIKAGMDTRQVIARFEAERQTLALMDHPNIAKVLDAGATESGRPYFVMELVKGIPITKFCDQQRLDTESRLKLFQKVCHAVQHAHQKGIIHRDLKPSNVLVAMYDDQPVPKVIDFGVAKATGEQLTEKTMFTRFGQIVGTLEYMSPEQAQFNNLDIDTRSDIYSLGAILYELLAGEPPFDRERLKSQALDETLKMIREEEPTRPSTRLTSIRNSSRAAADRQTSLTKLGSMLKGDLDWIVLKALEKDRTRRYETAASFREDVQRFLDVEPVLAGPPSAWYRAKKYFSRNRALVAVGGVAITSLMAIIIFSIVAAARISEHESTANKWQFTANSLNNFLLREVVGASTPGSELFSYDDVTVREAVLRANQKVDQRFPVPEERASVKYNLGEFLISVGEFGEARSNFKDVILIWSNVPGMAVDTALAKRNLARACYNLGDTETALIEAAEALEVLQSELGSADLMTLKAQHTLGVAKLESKSVDDAILAFTQVDDVMKGMGPDSWELKGLNSNLLGNCRYALGEYDRAEFRWREALEVFLELGDDLNAAIVRSNLSNVYWETGRQEESIRLGAQALETAQFYQPLPHPHTIQLLDRLARKKNSMGEWSAAVEDWRKALTAAKEKFGDRDPRTAGIMQSLGGALSYEGELEEALDLQTNALAILRSIFEDSHPICIGAMSDLASTFSRSGDTEQAMIHYRQAIDARKVILARNPQDWSNAINLGGACCNFGNFLSGNSDNSQLAIDSFNDAINALKSAEAIRQTTDAKRFLVNTYWSRGDVLSELGRFDEALEDAEAAIRLATTSGRRDAAILNKARILARQRQCSAAIEIVQDVLQRTEDADMYFLAAEIAAICIPTSAELIDLEPGREESINMAMDWLEQAHVRGYFEIDYRVTDFRENLLFSELRELPRFEALMSQISKEETKNSQSTKH